MYLHTADKTNKLFMTILSIMMGFYILTISLIIIRKVEFSISSGKKRVVSRYTRLIMTLPAPVTVEKKEPIKKTFYPKALEKKAEQKKPKKIKKEIKIKKVKPKQKKVEQVKKDLTTLGMLQLIGAIDESIDGIESFDDALLISQPAPQNKSFEEEISALLSERTSSEAQNFLDKEIEKQIGSSMSTLFEQPSTHSLRTLPGVLKKGDDDAEGDEARKLDTIEETITGYVDGLRFCYNKTLGVENTTVGKVVLRFAILASGTTDDVSIIANEVNDSRLDNCITDLVSRWTFPLSRTEKIVVTYPLEFSIKKS